MTRALGGFFVVLGLLAMPVALLGAVLMIFADLRLIGLVVAVFAVAVFIAVLPTAQLFGEDGDLNRTFAAVGLIVLLGVGVFLPLSLLHGIGRAERNTAGYALEYGDAVTAHVPDSCTQTLWNEGSRERSSIDCENATWTVRGQQVVGTLSVDDSDLRLVGDTFTVKELPAWAHGDKAFTKHSGSANFALPLSQWPDWLSGLLVPGATTVVLWMLLMMMKHT